MSLLPLVEASRHFVLHIRTYDRGTRNAYIAIDFFACSGRCRIAESAAHVIEDGPRDISAATLTGRFFPVSPSFVHLIRLRNFLNGHVLVVDMG